MTIFLNGLRKIGVLTSSPDDEKCKNQSEKNKPLYSCLPPRVPVIEASKTPGDAVNDALHPNVLQERNNNVVQRVSIKLVLSRSTQSTQTEDDFESTREDGEITDSSAITDDSRITFAGDPTDSDIQQQNSADSGVLQQNSADSGILPQNSADSGTLQQNSTDSGILQQNSADSGIKSGTTRSASSAQTGSSVMKVRSSITEESDTSYPDPTPSATQSGVDQVPSKFPVAPIPKPPRAHVSGQFLVGALIHGEASVNGIDHIMTHIESLTNQASDGPDHLEIRTTPRGRFDGSSFHRSLMQESHHNYSSESSHTFSGMTPTSATRYPRHLPEPKPWNGFRPERPPRRSDSPGTLVMKLKKLMPFLETIQTIRSGNSSEGSGMTAVQTNPSDHSSHVERMPRAESSRTSTVIKDLENERSLPEISPNLMSSTRLHQLHSSTLSRNGTDVSSYRGLPNSR